MGFEARKNLFKKGNDFTDTPTTFAGKLMLDLAGMETGILPGVARYTALINSVLNVVVCECQTNTYWLIIDRFPGVVSD